MSTPSPAQPESATASPDPRFILPLLVIVTAQLMLVLDDSIANIALPSIQNQLDISAASLPWVINAYIPTFGSLLLFGGRIGDPFGRRRTLQLGTLVFTIASRVSAARHEEMPA